SLFSLLATPSTEIYSLSLHDALPISVCPLHGYSYGPLCFGNPHVLCPGQPRDARQFCECISRLLPDYFRAPVLPVQEGAGLLCRSEEHTSELQSRENLVCRLLLEKKK